MQPLGADVDRLRPDQLAFGKLLQTMRRPSKHTADGEGRSEQLSGQSDAVQQQRGVKLDVGIKPPLRLVFAEQTQRGGFDASCEAIEALVSIALKKPLGCLRKHIGARIAHAVDAVPESHDPFTAIQFGADEGFGSLGSADLEDHVERRPRRPAM